MSLHHGKRFLFLLCVIVCAFLLNVALANACSCGPRGLPFLKPSTSQVVIIARVISVEKVRLSVKNEEATKDRDMNSRRQFRHA